MVVVWLLTVEELQEWYLAPELMLLNIALGGGGLLIQYELL